MEIRPPPKLGCRSVPLRRGACSEHRPAADCVISRLDTARAPRVKDVGFLQQFHPRRNDSINRTPSPLGSECPHLKCSRPPNLEEAKGHPRLPPTDLCSCTAPGGRPDQGHVLRLRGAPGWAPVSSTGKGGSGDTDPAGLCSLSPHLQGTAYSQDLEPAE